MIVWLVEKELPINAPSRGRSPLMIAARKNNLELVNLLISLGANQQAAWQTLQGSRSLEKALFEAVKWGITPYAVWLVEQGANIHHAGYRAEYNPPKREEDAFTLEAPLEEWTLLHLAAESNSLAIVQWLVGMQV